MTGRDDDMVDQELAGLAMAAWAAHERTVSAADTEGALANVRERIAAGDIGGEMPLPLHPDAGRPRSWWALAGAAAAVVALLGVGLVAVTASGDDDQLVAPVGLPPLDGAEVNDPSADRQAVSTPAPALDPGPDTSVAEESTPPTLGAEDAVDADDSDNESPDATPGSAAPDAAPDEADPPAPASTAVAPPTTAATSTTIVSDTVVVPPASEVEGLAIARSCDAERRCTSLASTADGRIVAFDPAREALEVYDARGRELLSEQPVGGAFDDVGQADDVVLEHIGPRDVAYVSFALDDTAESTRSLVAIPLKGSSAGAVVERWSGLDGSGDSRLVASGSGLVEVECCRAPSGAAPSTEATRYEWVDAGGDRVEASAPLVEIVFGDAGNQLIRRDASEREAFQLPAAYQSFRDFPDIVPTDDGGVLASAVVELASGTYGVIVDFDLDWQSGRVDNADVYWRRTTESSAIELLEPAGTVIVVDDGAFVRRDLDDVATRGWPGAAVTDLEVAATEAPGLNEYVTEFQPLWAESADTFAHQIVPTLGANETIVFDVDGSLDPVITVTTSGFLDDSVESAQRVITTERGDDGLLRLVSSTYGFRCQPGRGHQDYSTELCL